jgi:hypothetical protein
MVMAPSAVAAAESTTVMKAPVSGEFVNQCTGETIVTTGTSILIFRGTLGDGSYPVFERGVFQGTAVGQTTGTVYRVIISAMDPGVTNVTASGAVESTDVLIYRFVAPSGDDLFLCIAHHTTFNANGVLMANPVVVDAQCFQ